VPSNLVLTCACCVTQENSRLHVSSGRDYKSYFSLIKTVTSGSIGSGTGFLSPPLQLSPQALLSPGPTGSCEELVSTTLEELLEPNADGVRDRKAVQAGLSSLGLIKTLEEVDDMLGVLDLEDRDKS